MAFLSDSRAQRELFFGETCPPCLLVELMFANQAYDFFRKRAAPFHPTPAELRKAGKTHPPVRAQNVQLFDRLKLLFSM